MKTLYATRRKEGLGFSKRGYAAYLRGEKPKTLWPVGTPLTPTTPHHIEIGSGENVQRRLVMFFKPT